MDLSICIISLNSKAFVSACLDSIIEHTRGVSFELIVVDNGSTDGTQAMLRERYPQVHLIENQANLGFSKPMNKAFEVTKGEFILALNPDTLINADSLSAQVAYLRTHP
jgi:GT2 family glycosyltransferase